MVCDFLDQLMRRASFSRLVGFYSRSIRWLYEMSPLRYCLYEYHIKTGTVLFHSLLRSASEIVIIM